MKKRKLTPARDNVKRRCVETPIHPGKLTKQFDLESMRLKPGIQFAKKPPDGRRFVWDKDLFVDSKDLAWG